MKTTENAVRRRLATSAIVLALVVLGLYGLWRLPVDYLPNITYPLVKIQIKWPGATPEEIDTDIADPVERLMSTVDRLDYLESSSIEGLYNLNVYFEYGADVDVAFQDALAALTRAQHRSTVCFQGRPFTAPGHAVDRQFRPLESGGIEGLGGQLASGSHPGCPGSGGNRSGRRTRT
jgi:flavin-binding protein dodecin